MSVNMKKRWIEENLPCLPKKAHRRCKVFLAQMVLVSS